MKDETLSSEFISQVTSSDTSKESTLTNEVIDDNLSSGSQQLISESTIQPPTSQNSFLTDETTQIINSTVSTLPNESVDSNKQINALIAFIVTACAIVLIVSGSALIYCKCQVDRNQRIRETYLDTSQFRKRHNNGQIELHSI